MLGAVRGRRPVQGTREEPVAGELQPPHGLVGDIVVVAIDLGWMTVRCGPLVPESDEVVS